MPKDGAGHLWVTDEEDMAAAYAAALEVAVSRRGRYDAVFLAGDENEEEINLEKGRQLLGWQPRTHLKVDL